MRWLSFKCDRLPDHADATTAGVGAMMKTPHASHMRAEVNRTLYANDMHVKGVSCVTGMYVSGVSGVSVHCRE